MARAKWCFDGYTWKYNPLVAGLYRAVLKWRGRDVQSYVFVGTTGRSGTESLQRVLAIADSSVTFHEPYPILNGSVAQQLNNGAPCAARNAYNFVKSINVRRHALGHRVYVETNHLFIKSFVEYAIQDLGTKLQVVHLVRDPIAVARSITSLGHQPGTELGNIWYLDYKAPGNLIRMADVLEDHPVLAHPFCRSLWYWYETEARVAYWRAHAPEVRFHDCRTEDLNDERKIARLLQDMGLAFDPQRVSEVASTHANRKAKMKRSDGLSKDEAEQLHQAFQQTLIAHGYALPDCLQPGGVLAD